MNKANEKNKKICTKCKRLKDESEFYSLHKGKHKFSECKTCFKKRTNDNRKNKIEQYKKQKREYVAKDPQRWKEYSLGYQKENSLRITKIALIRNYYSVKIKKNFGLSLNRSCYYHKSLNEIVKVCLNLKNIFHDYKLENKEKILLLLKEKYDFT